MEFVYKKGNFPKDGLIYYLFNNKRNVYDSILVNATSNDSNSRHSIDFTNSYWQGGDGSNTANITFYIPIHILFKGYTIQTSNLQTSKGTCHPKEWIFSVSKDGFHKIHSQRYIDSNNEMNSALAHKYIEFEYPGYYHFYHVETVSSYCSQAKNFDFNQFDVYGTISNQPNHKITCHYNLNYLKFLPFLTIFLLLY